MISKIGFVLTEMLSLNKDYPNQWAKISLLKLWGNIMVIALKEKYKFHHLKIFNLDNYQGENVIPNI